MPTPENLQPIATVVAALVGGGFVLYVDRRNAYRVASVKFRAAVLAALSGLYPHPANWPRNVRSIDEVLRRAFPALQASVDEFRSFVPRDRQPAFDQAWRIYRLGKDGRECDVQDYWQYIPHNLSGIAVNGRSVERDNRLTYKEDFKRNVDRLLSFSS